MPKLPEDPIMLFMLNPEPPIIGLFAMLLRLFIPFMPPIVDPIDPAGRPNEDCCCCEGGAGRLKPDAAGVELPLPGGGGRENDDVVRFIDPTPGRCWFIERDDIELFRPLPYVGVCAAGGDIVLLLAGCIVEEEPDAQGFAVAVDQFTEADEAGCAGGGGNADCGALGCKGCENWVVDGAIAGRLARSGVTVLNDPCWALNPPRELVEGAAFVGLGVDQEKVAFCEALGCGKPGELIAEAVSPQPASMGLMLFELDFPLTSCSKSSSVAPVAASNCVPVIPPKDMKSSAGPAAAEPLVTPASSCNFFVCSSSTFRDRLLMSSIKDWNCLRLSSGPRLMLQRIGRISMAMNSQSA